MSIWSGLCDLIARVNPLVPPEDPTRTSAFTIGVIALAAKIAKADGRVTRDEVAAFRSLFHVEAEDEARVAQVYDYFRQDAAHYEYYARRLRRLLDDADIRRDILDALFAIAMADGEFHHNEEAFLRECAAIFDLAGADFDALLSRWVPDRWSPWEVLGLQPTSDLQLVRRRYRELVRESHPDTMASRGVPMEMIPLATRRLADINRSWEEIRASAA